MLAGLALALWAALAGPAVAQDTAAQDTAAQDTTPGSDPPEPFYEIATSDVLNIDIRGEPELSGTYPVRPDGRLALPLLGDIQVAGRTAGEIADALESDYARYLQDPRVRVTVVQATGDFGQRIRVIGTGVEPRSLLYNRGMTALDVVAQLGGLPREAAPGDAYILRQSDGTTRRIPVDLRVSTAASGETAARMPLRPGDTIVIPAGFLAGDVRLQSFAVFSQTYTDNVDLEPDDGKDEALITEVGPGVSLTADTNRVRGALEGRLLFQRESLDRDSNDVRADLSAAGTAEWAENLFFTDASASVSQRTVDSSRGSSADESNDSTEETVQSYRLSPYLTNRLGRIARTELRYSGTLTLISDASDEDADDTDSTRLRPGSEASDSVEHAVSATVASGPRFDRYSWTVTARASELSFEDSGDGTLTGAGDGSDQSQRSVQLRNRYALTRSFDLIGDIGYQELETDTAGDSFEAPLWAVGFEWRPSPDTSLFATVGRRNDDENLSLEARHAFSPRTEVRLSFQEEIATGQQRLASRNPDIDTVGAEPDSTDNFSVTDDTTRSQTLRATFQTELERTTIGLRATHRTEQQQVVDGDDTEESLGLSLDLSRPLSRNVTLSARAGYENVTFQGLPGIGPGTDEVEDDVYTGGLSLSYTGFQDIRLSGGYSYARRESTQANADYVENAVTISARINF